MSLESFENIERRIGGTIVENLSTPLEDCEYSETISDTIPELEETAERLETAENLSSPLEVCEVVTDREMVVVADQAT